MGYTTSAYHFYGIHVPHSEFDCLHPWGESERLDELIAEVNTVIEPTNVRLGHVTAGRYDDDMLFVGIITDDGPDWEVGLGEFRIIRASPSVPPGWDEALKLLADRAGYDPDVIGKPGWITVPSVD